MIQVFKTSWKGEIRVGLRFPYEKNTVAKVRQIKGAFFTPEIGAWHFKYNPEAYREFLDLNLPYQVEAPIGTTDTESSRSKSDITDIGWNTSTTVVPPEVEDADIPAENAGIKMCFNNSHITVSLPYVEEEVRFLKSLKGAWWHGAKRIWIVKATIENLEKLQSRFGCWNAKDYDRVYELIGLRTDPRIVELYSSPEFPKQVMVKIRGYGVDVDFIKKIPERIYEKNYKRWLIPRDQKILDRLVAHFQENGTQVVNRLRQTRKTYQKQEYSLKEKQTYFLAKYPGEHQKILREYTNVLIAQRYSWKTVTSYSGHFIRYLKFSAPKALSELTVQDANRYISEIASRKVSESTINIVISSIKFYYDKVVFLSDFAIDRIKRPRKSFRLPRVLSVQEVDRLLRSLENVKHVTILYTLYSSGLRLGEILKLTLEDISFDRNQLFIAGAKGKKDRVVMLSERLKDILRLYLDEYQPIHWLFEGQDRLGPYSERSVQSIVKSATKKANLNKRVTPHTLRHCFATHLLDGGVNIRYIQELLGHNDIKTTLIYTHVSTDKVTAVVSPLDRLARD